MGGIFSSVDEGAKVIVSGLSDRSVTILVIYPVLVETYIFQSLNDGTSEVMWTQAKAETTFPKISAFVAKCSFFELSNLKK